MPCFAARIEMIFFLVIYMGLATKFGGLRSIDPDVYSIMVGDSILHHGWYAAGMRNWFQNSLLGPVFLEEVNGQMLHKGYKTRKMELFITKSC